MFSIDLGVVFKG